MDIKFNDKVSFTTSVSSRTTQEMVGTVINADAHYEWRPGHFTTIYCIRGDNGHSYKINAERVKKI